jgi:hypothetical protein
VKEQASTRRSVGEDEEEEEEEEEDLVRVCESTSKYEKVCG